MYCPNCGSNNQAEIKFCTRCGTNLGVVSEVLSASQIGQSSPTTLLSRSEQDAPATIAAGQYSTDTINPGSVVEHTTRQLEDHAHQLNPESRSELTSQ
jgi:hypothetical protein